MCLLLLVGKGELRGPLRRGHWAEAVKAAPGAWWLSKMESSGLTLPIPHCVTWENPSDPL